MRVVLGGALVTATAWAQPVPTQTAALEPAPVHAAAGSITPAPQPVATRDFHIGLNLRTDFGARFYRMDLGVRLGRVDLIGVVDPFGLDNGDYDFDGIVRYDLGHRWSVWSGARLTVVPIDRARIYSEKLLIGFSGLMPSFGSDKVRLHSGVELAVHMHSSGGHGVMATWVCVDSPSCRKDHFVFGLFGRLEFATPF